MDKISVGAVSYLNTRPLLYGWETSGLAGMADVVEDYPARIASMLSAGTIDVGLVPVAALHRIPDPHIITDYCIGTEGEVASVAIFSELPLEQVDTILLDYQSRTSVTLARLLMADYWKKDVRFEHAPADFRSRIHGATAGVVIGDRALEQRQLSPYVYDLGSAWRDHTGLPFVFAAWVANKQLPAAFISRFNDMNAYGLSRIDEVVAHNPYPVYDLHKYYTENISYTLTPDKRMGLERFLRDSAPYLPEL